MAASTRWRNLGIAAGAATAVLFAVFDLYQWATAYLGDHFHNDFTFYFAAARVGLAHGWSTIYDLSLQQAQLNHMGSGITVAQLARFISPPPVAWAAVPFTALPYPVAYFAWSTLLLGALAATWWLAAPGTGPARVILLAAAVGWLPVIFGLQLGQPGLLVALGVAACYALVRRGLPAWGGLALGLVVLKPQLAFLVPPALLVAGRGRAFLASVIALGLLAAASALALGPSGIATYESRLAFAAGVSVNRELTLAPLVGGIATARALDIVISGWALALVYRMRHRSAEWLFVPVLVGGLLASPYLHLDDFAMLGLAGWLALRAQPARLVTLAVLLGAMIVEGEPMWGPGPVIAAELAAMCLLTLVAYWRSAGPSEDPGAAAPTSRVLEGAST